MKLSGGAVIITVGDGRLVSAQWAGVTVAASRSARVADGLVYFPPDEVRTDLLRPSDTTSRCGRKGLASYADVVVGDAVCVDAAWTYPQPTAAARDLAGWWAFWRDVRIVGDGDLIRAWSAQTRQWLDT